VARSSLSVNVRLPGRESLTVRRAALCERLAERLRLNSARRPTVTGLVLDTTTLSLPVRARRARDVRGTVTLRPEAVVPPPPPEPLGDDVEPPLEDAVNDGVVAALHVFVAASASIVP
jgi:hypothetical protein